MAEVGIMAVMVDIGAIIGLRCAIAPKRISLSANGNLICAAGVGADTVAVMATANTAITKDPVAVFLSAAPTFGAGGK